MLAVKRDSVVLPEQPWQVPHAYIFGLKIIMQVMFFYKGFHQPVLTQSDNSITRNRSILFIYYK